MAPNSTAGNVSLSCEETYIYGSEHRQHHVIWNVVYAVIFVPIVFGNGLILASIWRFRNIRTKIHLLIGNLAIDDFCVGAILIPLDTVANLSELNTYRYFIAVENVVFNVIVGGSCFGLLLISVERFATVAFPLRHLYFTKRKLIIVIFATWAYVALFAVTPVLVNGDVYHVDDCGCSSGTLPWYMLFHDANFVLAMGVNIVLYIAVVRIAVNKASRRRVPGLTISHPKSRDISKTTTMAAVLGTFVVFWGPCICLTLWTDIADAECGGPLFHARTWSLLLGVTNSAINWLIYGLCNRDFRRAFKVMLHCTNRCAN